MTAHALNDSTRMRWTVKEPIPAGYRFVRYHERPEGGWDAEIEKMTPAEIAERQALGKK